MLVRTEENWTYKNSSTKKINDTFLQLKKKKLVEKFIKKSENKYFFTKGLNAWNTEPLI